MSILLVQSVLFVSQRAKVKMCKFLMRTWLYIQPCYEDDLEELTATNLLGEDDLEEMDLQWQIEMISQSKEQTNSRGKGLKNPVNQVLMADIKGNDSSEKSI
ncbi:hypothetical protein L1987_67219 [Smallanthus sonchifolius]|uniref:Uncharacterized protein n=1 Tax=Smallanthus sonchifolius TaxID=185202 RepID=A0ACB9BZK2_9ASTR|nr:hypothetical protein L1987_67219 [Smallanthus sonchifolius]